MRKNILLIIILLTSLIAQSQNLKSYTGAFGDGKATYTYYNDEYGNKVLDGSFSYSQTVKVDRATATVKIVGSFSKGKRNGRWSFESVAKGSYTKNIMGSYVEYRANQSNSVVANYLNGILHGDFSLRGLQSDYIPDLGQYGHINSDLTLQMRFSNGVLDGKFLIIDKDNKEPENLTGFVKQGYFEGLIMDNGKEIVFQDGVMIKNQNWDKTDQDELKEKVSSYLMVKNKGAEGLSELDLHLDSYCESYPSTMIEKYISKFYEASDWCWDEIPGDEGYESSGCFYMIISDKNKADFTQSDAWKYLEKQKQEGHTFEYIIKYNEVESNFDQYKASSLKIVRQQYQTVLNQLDDALGQQIQFKKILDSIQQDFNSFYDKEYKKKVIDYAQLLTTAKNSGRISAYYTVLNNREKIYFSIEENMGAFLPARKFASQSVKEIQSLLYKHHYTSFNNPKNGERIDVTLSESRNFAFDAQKILKELKINGIQLIQLEDQLIKDLMKLNSENKKGSFERILSDKLLAQFDQIVIQVYLGNMNNSEYQNELEKIKGFLDLATGFKGVVLQIENEKAAIEQEVKGARNSIEQVFITQVNNEFSKKVESLNNELKNIQELTDSQLNASTKSAKDYIEKLTTQRKAAEGLKIAIDEFNTANTKLTSVEFEDKNISKLVKEVNEQNFERIKVTYIDNKTLTISEIDKIIEDCINSIQLYLAQSTSFLTLQNTKLSKEQVKEFNSYKKDTEKLSQNLLKLIP